LFLELLLKADLSQGPIGIIFAPARELCIQIYHEVPLLTPHRIMRLFDPQQAKHFMKHLNIHVSAIYGGAPISEQVSSSLRPPSSLLADALFQIAELKRGPDIVVCTPGRMIDMLAANAGRVTNLRRVTFVVIDEADRMFDLGFEPQIMRILGNVRPDRQMLLLSATFPKPVEQVRALPCLLLSPPFPDIQRHSWLEKR
jgi:ATP-dependent RNA helicase DDX46/PRP5